MSPAMLNPEKCAVLAGVSDVILPSISGRQRCFNSLYYLFNWTREQLFGHIYRQKTSHRYIDQHD